MKNIIKFGLLYEEFNGAIVVLKYIINEKCDVSTDLIARYTRTEWELQGCE